MAETTGQEGSYKLDGAKTSTDDIYIKLLHGSKRLF